MSGCGALPPRGDHPAEQAFDTPAETSLGRLILPDAQAQAHPHQSGFRVLGTGGEAFFQRAALIEAAERSIDAQYYIWNSDVSGRYLARRLVLAADRGVRVRLLLDDMNVGGRDDVIAALDRHPNIQIRIFNPSAVRSGPGKWLGFASDFRRLNRRMHNKTFVVDAAVGIVGGRNIGDEYFDLHPEMNFRDRDVLAVGPIVRDMSENFDAYWNSPWSYPIAQLAPKAESRHAFAQHQARADASELSGLTRPLPQGMSQGHAGVIRALPELTWAAAVLVFDPPARDMHVTADVPRQSAQSLREIVERSQSEVLIESAYLVLGDTQLDTLGQVVGRGVRVAALTNSMASNDVPANHAAYAGRRTAMLAQGLELYELRPQATACGKWITSPDFCGGGELGLHAKSAVIDRRILYVGSFNFNLRSIYLNGETVLIIESPELAGQVAEDIEQAMMGDNSWQVTLSEDGQLRWTSEADRGWTREPQTSWWQRFKSGLVRMLPIEKYL